MLFKEVMRTDVCDTPTGPIAHPNAAETLHWLHAALASRVGEKMPSRLWQDARRMQKQTQSAVLRCCMSGWSSSLKKLTSFEEKVRIMEAREEGRGTGRESLVHLSCDVLTTTTKEAEMPGAIAGA